MKNLNDLKQRRADLALYSEAQRVVITEGVIALKRPISSNGVIGIVKSHPSAVLMSGGGVLLGAYLAKKLSKFSSGLWLGKRVLSMFRNGTSR